jgi:hypothetical protein
VYRTRTYVWLCGSGHDRLGLFGGGGFGLLGFDEGYAEPLCALPTFLNLEFLCRFLACGIGGRFFGRGSRCGRRCGHRCRCRCGFRSWRCHWRLLNASERELDADDATYSGFGGWIDLVDVPVETTGG